MATDNGLMNTWFVLGIVLFMIGYLLPKVSRNDKSVELGNTLSTVAAVIVVITGILSVW